MIDVRSFQNHRKQYLICKADPGTINFLKPYILTKTRGIVAFLGHQFQLAWFTRPNSIAADAGTSYSRNSKSRLKDHPSRIANIRKMKIGKAQAFNCAWSIVSHLCDHFDRSRYPGPNCIAVLLFDSRPF